MKQTRTIRTLKTTYNNFPAGTLVSIWEEPVPRGGFTLYRCYASYNKSAETYIGLVPSILLV